MSSQTAGSTTSREPSGPHRTSALRRVASVAAKSTEWLVLSILVAACIPPVLLRRQSLTVIPWLNIVDGSWILDTCYKAAGGVWFGRDVAMTRGPLYQWLSSTPSRLIGPSLGTIYATSHTLPFLCVVGAAFLIARLLLAEVPAWRRTVFILLAVVFWSDSDPRTLFPPLALAIFLHITDALPDSIASLAGRALAAAAVCITAFLFSADTGLYATAALLLCSVATIIFSRVLPRVLKFLLLTAGWSAVGVVAINWLFGSPFSFRIWWSSLELISSYRWSLPLPMHAAETRRFVATLLLGVFTFGAAWLWRYQVATRHHQASSLSPDQGACSRRPAFLFAGFLLAILILQSGLVRSDPSHLRTGICPMVILCGVIAFDTANTETFWRFVPPVFALVLTLVFARAEVQFSPRYVAGQVRQMIDPVRSCPSGWSELDDACVPQLQADIFGMIARYVDRNVAPDDSIVVFPYETIIGLLSHRQVASGVLQSFLVNGDYLTSLEIGTLQQRTPLFGLYFPDGIMGSAVDSVPSFTRSPDVWFYLLRHYSGDTAPLPGALWLIRDDSRDRLTLSA